MFHSIALILGVGALEGIGGALCLKAASVGFHVIAVGRTREKLDAIVGTLRAHGGNLKFVVYNAGNSFRHSTADMTSDFFEDAWRICCFGGFIAGQAAANWMASGNGGSLLFTGATASMKARPPFIAFAAAKAALRATAAGLAREYGPKGVHVGHIIIDGGVEGAIRRKRLPKEKDSAGENELLDPTAIAEAYWQLHLQHRSAWSFEIDLRPFNELF